MLTSASVINALGFSRPVLAPELGMISDLIESGVNGFLYAPGSTDALADAMLWANSLDTGERARLEKAAFRSATALDWSKTASALTTALTELRNEPR